MAFDRDIWSEKFAKNVFPSLPCPMCGKGRLALYPGTLRIEEPKWSIGGREEPAFDPTWISERFTAWMQCNAASCEEIVVVIGDTVVEEVVDENHGWAYDHRLRVRAMFPSPPIIEIPKATPCPIRDQIEKAFQLYWLDYGSSAGRLRASVESVLDDFKIPRNAVTKSGKKTRLDLAARIKAFKQVDSTHADTFDALRYVGNVGAHEDDLKQEILLDAFEIYEHALGELYGKNTARIAALKKKIISAKGKY